MVPDELLEYEWPPPTRLHVDGFPVGIENGYCRGCSAWSCGIYGTLGWMDVSAYDHYLLVAH